MINLASDIIKLYQHIEPTDRRKTSVAVENDRRSGVDRRAAARVLDKKTDDDIKFVKNALSLKPTGESSVVFSALKTIAPIRRFTSVSDNINNSDYLKAAGLLGIAVVNVPEDTRDLKNALADVIKKEKPGYDYKNYQSEFSFIRGTLLEPVLNKMGEIGAKIHELDTSLYHTKFGEYICKKFNIGPESSLETGRVTQKIVKDESGQAIIKDCKALAYKVEGGAFSRVAGRALLRTPVLGLLVLGALEVPDIAKAYIEPKDSKTKLVKGTTQLAKSAVNLTTVTACVGTAGAILARKGHFGSLAGIGIGAIAGMGVSKLAQNEIDKFSESYSK